MVGVHVFIEAIGDQANEREARNDGDCEKSIVIGQHRRFLGDLLSEKRQPFGLRQSLISQNLCIGAGERLNALGDDGVDITSCSTR